MRKDIALIEDLIFELKSFGLDKETILRINALENLIKEYEKLEAEKEELEERLEEVELMILENGDI